MTNNSRKITVYYDGKCGLCSKEIRHYKKIAAEGVFDWQDITMDSRSLKQRNISLSQGLKFLHVVDRDDVVHIGVDAFIIIWRELKKWRYLATIVSLPGIKQFSRIAYKAFAKWRFGKLEHCQIILEEEN